MFSKIKSWFLHRLHKRTFLYTVRLLAEDFLVFEVHVFAITRRRGWTIYHCEETPKIHQPTRLTHSELYSGITLIDRAMMKQPISCLNSSTVQYYHAVRDA